MGLRYSPCEILASANELQVAQNKLSKATFFGSSESINASSAWPKKA